MARQPQGTAGLLLIVAVIAGRHRQIETPLGRHLAEPAEIDVGIVDLRRQSEPGRPVEKMDAIRGAYQQGRCPRGTGQSENRLKLQVGHPKAVRAETRQPRGVEHGLLKHPRPALRGGLGLNQ